MDNLYSRNSVYKINCNDCNFCYIGQICATKRRMYEHELAVINVGGKSVMAMHCKDEGHSFNFEKPHILDNEPPKFKRLFSGMLHIHSNHNTLNRKEDIHNLKFQYKKSMSILNKKR